MFCTKCGSNIPADVKICPQCGASAENVPSEPPSPQPSSQNYTPNQPVPQPNTGNQQSTGPQFNANNFQGADHTGEFNAADIQANKGISILSYFSFLFFVPLLAAKDSQFAKFHANQGLVLFIAEIAFWVINVISYQIPIIGWLLRLICTLGSLATFVFSIMGIVYAVQGQAKELPLIGQFKLIK